MESAIQGKDFETSLRAGLKGLQCGPEFLFREESDSKPVVDDYALAARLSYFLWSSQPDEALLSPTARSRLRNTISTSSTSPETAIRY